MKEKDIPPSPEFYFPSDEGEEPMDPDVEPSDEGGEPMDDVDALIEELNISLEEVKNSGKPDSVQSAESAQEQLKELERSPEEVENSDEPDSVQSAESAQEQLSELQVSELQAEVRQQIEGIEGIGDAVIEREYAILLEGQPLFIVKVRDKLYLVLKKEEPGFDRLGGDDYAHTIDPEKVEDTFTWLNDEDKKVSNFYDQSTYLKNVAASRGKKTA